MCVWVVVGWGLEAVTVGNEGECLILGNFSLSFREGLNVATVPLFKMHNIGVQCTVYMSINYLSIFVYFLVSESTSKPQCCMRVASGKL